MTTPVKVTRQFSADFSLACRYYKCTPAEVEIMKACARNDLANATISFAAMAREILR